MYSGFQTATIRKPKKAPCGMELDILKGHSTDFTHEGHFTHHVATVVSTLRH